MSVEKLIDAYAKLMSDLTAAVNAAVKAGLAQATISSALETVKELVDDADGE